MSRLEDAKKQYLTLGVDADKAIKTLAEIPISVHCWQGDDVIGLEPDAGALSGGIQATGNYPGRARNFEELTADFDKAISLIPGKKKINLHASYGVFNGQAVARDEIEPKHFAPWVNYAKSRGIGIDFNPTFFSHPMVKDNLTLSSPNEEVRSYWVRHGIASRKVASYIAQELGSEVINNVWIPDGYKDIPADRLGPRQRLKRSLDEIFAEKLPGIVDCVESKVFGIGLESYTVGSSEFYLCYAAARPDVYNLMDAGHYHPTEVISDKIPSLLVYKDKLPLHVTRPVRWDSDHVVLFDDEIREIAKEIVRNDAVGKVRIGLDFFDASINRVAAWVVGTRSMQKALLYALLQPNATMQQLQNANRFTELMVLQEECKTLPFGDIWQAYCESQNVAPGMEWLEDIKAYEDAVLSKRR